MRDGVAEAAPVAPEDEDADEVGLEERREANVPERVSLDDGIDAVKDEAAAVLARLSLSKCSRGSMALPPRVLESAEYMAANEDS